MLVIYCWKVAKVSIYVKAILRSLLHRVREPIAASIQASLAKAKCRSPIAVTLRMLTILNGLSLPEYDCLISGGKHMRRVATRLRHPL